MLRRSKCGFYCQRPKGTATPPQQPILLGTLKAPAISTEPTIANGLCFVTAEYQQGQNIEPRHCVVVVLLSWQAEYLEIS